MIPAWILLLVGVPFLGILVLGALLNRWGRKHDPMGGTARTLWSTKGTQTRGDWPRD